MALASVHSGNLEPYHVFEWWREDQGAYDTLRKVPLADDGILIFLSHSPTSICGENAMERQQKVRKRTRDGCWTCRRRKKKCDGTGVPCGNCTRLGLDCENQVKLVWEDDVRRVGMKRRGPNSTVKNDFSKNILNRAVAPESSNHTGQRCTAGLDSTMAQFYDVEAHGALIPDPVDAIVRYQQISPYPRNLDSIDSLLLNHYIQRFSREYPTCSGPRNPFLSVFIPLAMKCTMVLDSLLALSGAQRWQNGSAPMERDSLRLRQQALKGARKLLLTEDLQLSAGNPSQLYSNAQSVAPNSKATLLKGLTSMNEENLLFLLTSSVLFLLYEKVSGEPTWKPHLDFISHFFERSLTSLAINAKQSPEISEAVRFLHDIFVYNDLVRSTSLKTRTISNFYLTATMANGSRCSPLETAFFPSEKIEQEDFRRRYYFPNLIARLSAGDLSVTEQDIAAWDGSIDWLPSFALDRLGSIKADNSTVSDTTMVGNDRTIITELYRTAARIYQRQILSSRVQNTALSDRVSPHHVDLSLSELAASAHYLMTLLPEGSMYENALLWPIGIAAKELTTNQAGERSNVLLRLCALEGRFQMRHFRKVQEVLLRHWANRDGFSNAYEFHREEDPILLG